MNKTPQIFLTCGSGGVGKTTISAALGLKFAQEGQKVIVLTIDPAKRLATSLGIKDLTDDPKKITIPNSKNSKGEMWAMMLDTKRTFDRLIEKHASSEEKRQRILDNKLYQHMSQMLSGTQEYMAMERLYEIYQKDEYDVIIVDTPPMQNAKDFLVAPQKMVNMIDNSMLSLLLKPTLSLGKTSFKLLGKGTDQILKIFDRITGFDFLKDISEMMISFQDLLGGFQSRADAVRELLRLNSTQFLIVCTSLEHSVSEAKSFLEQLDTHGYHAKAIIVNRVYQGQIATTNKLTAWESKLKKYYTTQQVKLLISNYKNYQTLIKRDKTQIQRLQELMEPGQLTQIPLFYSDVHDLSSLQDVSNCLSLPANS